jgi:hypothetical protein
MMGMGTEQESQAATGRDKIKTTAKAMTEKGMGESFMAERKEMV